MEDLAKKWGDRPIYRKDQGIYYGFTEDRINYIRRRVLWAFKKFAPDLVVIEEYAFSKSTAHAHVLGECGGVVKHYLWKLQAPIVPIHTGTLKLHATGNGHATKDEVLQAVQKIWPECPDSFDMADAFTAAAWGLTHYDDLVDA